MLSDAERIMLHWLAREIPLPAGAVIVDAGAFLGGSTLALATGLRKRTKDFRNEYRIHSYDMFVAPNDPYSLELIGHNRKPGDSVLDLYVSALGELKSSTVIHAGDLMAAPAPGAPTALQFIDVAKTRALNAKIVIEFFPLLIPDKSIVVQQDYNDHSCPWINATMEYLHEYFDFLCDMRGSRVFRNTRAIPLAALRDAAYGLSLSDELDLVLRGAARGGQDDTARFISAVSGGWSVFERDGVDAALSFLDNLPYRQTWEGESYVDFVKTAMKGLGDKSSLDRYHRGYFRDFP
ncbi:MAG: hypothetical protein U1E30_05955 [Rhodoblastus sp.]